jgi:hypothetical protein
MERQSRNPRPVSDVAQHFATLLCGLLRCFGIQKNDISTPDGDKVEVKIMPQGNFIWAVYLSIVLNDSGWIGGKISFNSTNISDEAQELKTTLITTLKAANFTDGKRDDYGNIFVNTPKTDTSAQVFVKLLTMIWDTYNTVEGWKNPPTEVAVPVQVAQNPTFAYTAEAFPAVVGSQTAAATHLPVAKPKYVVVLKKEPLADKVARLEKELAFAKKELAAEQQAVKDAEDDASIAAAAVAEAKQKREAARAAQAAQAAKN